MNSPSGGSTSRTRGLVGVVRRGKSSPVPSGNRPRILKVCSRCRNPKPPADFYARQDRPGRERPHCSDCHRELAARWQAENPERAAANKRAYAARNPEANREYCRRYRAKLKAKQNQA